MPDSTYSERQRLIEKSFKGNDVWATVVILRNRLWANGMLSGYN